MNTYEKITAVVIAILVILMVILSFNEITEAPGGEEHERERHSDFDKSLGQRLEIGPFDVIEKRSGSKEREEDCDLLKPIILATLHDLKEVLAKKVPSLFSEGEDAFEVNEATLDIFCDEYASITIASSDGKRLVFEKEPFSRVVREYGSSLDEGRVVKISATVFSGGEGTPIASTTYESVLIPDRYLDFATSSAQ